MHHESQFNTKNRPRDVDLLEDRKREQYAADVRLNPCVALMGYDPLRIIAERYTWGVRW